jgi:hypothetical protein
LFSSTMTTMCWIAVAAGVDPAVEEVAEVAAAECPEVVEGVHPPSASASTARHPAASALPLMAARYAD